MNKPTSNSPRKPAMRAPTKKVVDPETEATKEMIIHMLSIYPVLSPTMLQAGIGPYQKPAHWRPILEELIHEGVVVREQEERKTPKERFNTYTKLRLNDEFLESYMKQRAVNE